MGIKQSIFALILIIFISGCVQQEQGAPEEKQKLFDMNNPGKFIQADFIKLDTITQISRFRSGAGHSFPYPDGEGCRSMKHYFVPQQTKESLQFERRDYERERPGIDPETAIPIYSPVDGTITKIEEEQNNIGQQIYIMPDAYSDVEVMMFHVYKLDDLEAGKKVKAGEQIGNIGQYQWVDIAIQVNSFQTISGQYLRKRDYVSYFSVMPDGVFAKYKDRGAKSQEDFVLTKEYRDSHPLKCNGVEFAEVYNFDEETYVRLSGFVEVHEWANEIKDGKNLTQILQ